VDGGPAVSIETPTLISYVRDALDVEAVTVWQVRFGARVRATPVITRLRVERLTVLY